MEQKYGIFSPVLGIKRDYPSILLKEGYVLEDINDTKDVIFNQGKIESAMKRLKSNSVQLPHSILHHQQFKLRSGTYYDLFCTKRDIAYYDSSNSRYKYLTPKYDTGVIMVTNASTHIYGGYLIDDCDDDPVTWTDASGGDVTPAVETTIKKENTGSVKLAVAATAGVENLAYNNKDLDLTDYDTIGFWFYSSVALDAGDLKFKLNDAVALGGVDQESINFPAIAATTWTWVELTLADPSNCSAIKSIGIHQAVDKGEMDLYIDFIVAGDWAGQLNANDYITIGTTYTTDDTWYLISTVTDTHIVISAVYAGSTAYQKAYLARCTYDGGDTDYWRSIVFNDKWIATNNAQNFPQSWDGNSANLATLLNANAPKAKYITEFENYVILGYIIVSGTNYPQKYAWCALGDETAWNTGDAGESTITGTQHAINGFSPGTLEGYKIIATEGGFYRIHLVSGDEVFHREVITTDLGINAPDSLVNYGRYMYGWCSDNTFRRISISTWEEIISKPIEQTTKTLNPSYKQYIQGTYNDEFHMIMWLIPNENSTGRLNQLLTYDLDDNGAWGTINVQGTCFGTHFTQDAYTWDTLSFATWAAWDWGLWDYRAGFANFLLTYIPDYTGYNFILFGGETDDGVVYERSFVVASDLENQRGLGHLKRLLKTRVFVEAETDGLINVEIKRDREISWQPHQQVAGKSLIKTGYEYTAIDFYFDYLATHYSFKLKAENKYKFLGMIIYFDPEYGDEE